MPKTNFQSIDEYISEFDETDRAALAAIREIIREAVPEAEEAISYQLPAFKFHGWIFYFSAYADHYAISCPPPFTVFEAFKDELSPYEVTKTAVKFPKRTPVPLPLIRQMSAFRANENRQRARDKSERKKGSGQ